MSKTKTIQIWKYLKTILENKPKNELTEKKSKNLFSRFSSFFGVDNNRDMPSGPGIKIEDKIETIETIDTDTNKDFEEKLNITEPSKPSKSFDLFKEKNDPKENALV